MKKIISVILALICSTISPDCANSNIPEKSEGSPELAISEEILDFEGFTYTGTLTENDGENRITYEKQITESENIDKLAEIFSSLKEAELSDADYLKTYYSIDMKNEATGETASLEAVDLLTESNGVLSTSSGFILERSGQTFIFDTDYGRQTYVFAKVLSNELISEENITETRKAPCYDENYAADSENHKKGRIVFIDHYVNNAWGYEDSGSFVDDMGDLYYFDIACLENTEDSRSLLDILYEEVYYKCRPAMHTDPEKIAECCEKIPDINTSAAFETKFAAYDAGQSMLYIVDNSELIALYETGVSEGGLNDLTAISIVGKYSSLEFERYRPANKSQALKSRIYK